MITINHLTKKPEQDNSYFIPGPFKKVFGNFFDNFLDVIDDVNRTTVDFKPSVDVKEDDKFFYIKAELPGIDEKDINVEVHDRTLTIKGEKKETKKEENDRYHFVESSYGSFQRSFSLPDNVNPEKIKASLKNGILQIELPKDEAKAPKKIDIKVGS